MAATGHAAPEYDSTSRYFQPGSALHRVLQEAPYLPRCSDDKTATRVRPREYAIRYPYMQVNRPGFVSWLIFDLDHANAMAWEDAGLPAPNLVVRNRQSGHSHLYYAIPPICTTANARSKPIDYMRAVYAAFAVRLGADLDFHSGPVAKTPGHPWWLTHELHSHVYELGELADCVDLDPAGWRRPALDAVGHSRHCMLFEQLRHHAYAVVGHARQRGTFEAFSQQLEAFALARNRFAQLGFSQDLPYSSLKATVKSVARWTWDRYTGGGRCHRGVMQIDADLPLVERQRLAAARTHGVRHQTTAAKIRVACRQLRQQGLRLTQVAIAKLAGLSRQALRAYRYVIEEGVGAAGMPAQQQAANADVKFGVHQVTAAPEGRLVALASQGVPMKTTPNDVPGRPPAGGRVTAAADTSPSDAGQRAEVDVSGVIVANDRDRRSLVWLREQVGDTAIAAAVAQLAGQRRPYVSNVAKALGVELPRSLALTSVDTARVRLAALRSLIKVK